MSASPLRSFFYLALLGFALLTLALVVRSGMFARHNPGRPLNSAMREALAESSPQLTRDDAALLDRTYPNARITPSGLRYIMRSPGTGDGTPRIGGEVMVQVAARLLDGTPLENSYQQGTPLKFRIGVGDVLPAWDEAFLAMKKGEKRTLVAPYWLAYGVKGRPPAIPPKSTIIFEVELLNFR